MEPNSQHLADAILRLQGGENSRKHGFDALASTTRSVLVAYQVKRGMSPSQAEDIAQDALLRMWRNIDRLEFPSVAHWLAYAKRVTDRLGTDIRGRDRHEVASDDVSDTVASDQDFVAAIANKLEQQALHEHADDLWLGDAPSSFPTRVLAATLLFVDQVPKNRVVRWLKRQKYLTDQPSDIMQWVGHERVLRTVAYQQLYKTPSEVLSFVLGYAAESLQPGLNIDHDLVARKYLGNESTANILNSISDHAERDELFAFFERCDSRLPFLYSMVHLWGSIPNQESKATALGKPGLWKRLAFQYTLDGLPHLEFVARFAPVAEIASFKIEPMTMHAWISNKRLQKELTTYINQRSGGATHDES